MLRLVWRPSTASQPLRQDPHRFDVSDAPLDLLSILLPLPYLLLEEREPSDANSLPGQLPTPQAPAARSPT
jgi:hypothetical protein